MDQEEDYSQYAGDVKGQAGLTVGQMFGGQQAPQTEQDISMMLTGNKYAHLERMNPDPAYVTARRKYAEKQAEERKAAGNADFRINDAKFYAGIGDYSAVESVMKSKGPSLFQVGEAIDLEESDGQGKRKNYQFIMSPKGSYSVNDDNGMPVSVSTFGLARRMGVKSLPFKGGDMKAQDFRALIGRVQRFQVMSNQLREIYSRNAYLGSMDPSEDASTARAIESNIKMDYLSIMKDMKGMGGNVSDNDMAIAESMVPQRASKMFARLGGNEMVLLDNAREGVLSKLKEVAGNNGIDLIDTRQNAKQRTMLRGTVGR
jgi:hypothetical protein